MRRLLAALAAASVVWAAPLPAHAAKTDPSCVMTGAGSPARNVELCIQASYKPREGRCPVWRRFLVGIGSGGRHLEEGNGAVLAETFVRKLNGEYAGRWLWDNLFETSEDHYRRFYDPRNFRGSAVWVGTRYELRVDGGRNRSGVLTDYLYPQPHHRC